jgi:hypothetical protein
MSTITSFEVIDHGEDGSSYFPGCGVAFIRFAHVATGVGDTGAEALEDALEQMAMGGHPLTAEQEAEAHTYLSEPDRSAWGQLDHSECDSDHNDDDWNHYVSIRYNVEGA